MSGLSEQFKNFLEIEDKDASSEVIQTLSDTDKNLQGKTDIKSPIHIAYLTSLAENLEEKNLIKASKFLGSLIKNYEALMISHDRQGRKEIIEALHRIEEKKESLAQKLISPQRDVMNE